uniref:Uncharacterized protein n=1 Tax=Panagrolaimus superbus TaxID=310955 RepID=A0A914ZDN0_9BILA
MLLFVKNEYCITVFNAINKANAKSSNRAVRTNDTNDDIFKNNFFFPILKAIENQRTGFVELKNIFIDLFNSFEDVERRNYLKMVLPA